ncbi:MAG: ABC transporter substrate-binding protein [Sphingomonadales bacterium]|nr:ABC transporter substrate-binding protein [Sphingomonadales bacterium]
MRQAAALALLATLTGCQQRAPLPHLRGIASIDFCADQMTLGLLPHEQIRAVSFETDSDASFSKPLAKGLPRLRPQLEDIVALRPAVVVRSYGGGAQLDRQLKAVGIRVVQIGFPQTLADVRSDVLRVGDELGADERAKRLVAGFDAELAVARRQPSGRGTALYVTPGDVTTGPGGLVAEVISVAGYRPYRTEPGWGTLPLEQMVHKAPDVVFRAFFDSARYQQDYWTSSRHPVVARASADALDVEVPGAWISCGNWLTGHAVAKLAAAKKEAP